MHGRPVAIVGIHATEQARSLPHRTSLDLTWECVRGAVADAGLDLADVDGAAVAWAGPGGAPQEQSANWTPWLGDLRWTSDDPLDHAGVRGLQKASTAIAAGACEVAVMATGHAGGWASGTVGAGLGVEFADHFGSFVAPQFALVAARHLHETGTTIDQAARVAATIRNHGHTNPEAVMHGRGPYTVSDVLDSPVIASPLHRLMVCLVAEGGFGLVVTTLERARDLPHPPVAVLGAELDVRGPAYSNPPRLDALRDLGRPGLERILGNVGIGRDDLDVLSLYDSNAYEILLQLEALGFVGRGEAGALVDEGGIDPGGRWPVNLDGGLLAHAWCGAGQLTARVVEAARQVRGTAVQQVEDAHLALVTNAGSGAQHTEIAVLGSDRA